jgi:hypothetical protein
MKPAPPAARQAGVYHIILAHGDSLAAQHVVLGDAQGGSSAPGDGEAPGTTLRLVTGLVVHLRRDGVHPFRQAHAGGVGEAARCVDLGGDHFAVQHQRGAEGLHPRAGLRTCPACTWSAGTLARASGPGRAGERSRRISQGGGDDRPGGDDRAVGRNGIADNGRLAVVLEGEEGDPIGRVPGTAWVCSRDSAARVWFPCFPFYSRI